LCAILFGNIVLCTSSYTVATGMITDTLSAVILLHVEEIHEKYF
jgi:tetrahydromethanopterin S-methyltransferase subunit B